MLKTRIAKRWARGAVLMTCGMTFAACEQIESLDLPFLSQEEASDGDAALSLDSGGADTRDVEAPDVFQKSEAGLWDGRPSLGGVWVAHPDVTDPERVIIRNEDNGRFVVGALFRRERENPGPSLQVSSDAAEELGMLAGAPANLNVVALRREEVTVAPPATTDFDAPIGDAAPVGLAPPADIAATPLDATPTIAPTTAPVLAAGSAAAAVDAIANAAAAVNTAETNAAAAVTTTPLPSATAPAAALAPLSATTPAPVIPAPATSTLEKPFIQIGIFSVEANANDAAARIRGDGMSASVLEQTSQDSTFWRVLVGPAPNAQDRTAILAKIQALGFSDAYFVTN